MKLNNLIKIFLLYLICSTNMVQLSEIKANAYSKAAKRSGAKGKHRAAKNKEKKAFKSMTETQTEAQAMMKAYYDDVVYSELELEHYSTISFMNKYAPAIDWPTYKQTFEFFKGLFFMILNILKALDLSSVPQLEMVVKNIDYLLNTKSICTTCYETLKNLYTKYTSSNEEVPKIHPEELLKERDATPEDFEVVKDYFELTGYTGLQRGRQVFTKDQITCSYLDKLKKAAEQKWERNSVSSGSGSFNYKESTNLDLIKKFIEDLKLVNPQNNQLKSFDDNNTFTTWAKEKICWKTSYSGVVTLMDSHWIYGSICIELDEVIQRYIIEKNNDSDCGRSARGLSNARDTNVYHVKKRKRKTRKPIPLIPLAMISCFGFFVGYSEYTREDIGEEAQIQRLIDASFKTDEPNQKAKQQFRDIFSPGKIITLNAAINKFIDDGCIHNLNFIQYEIKKQSENEDQIKG